jgi:hypothetical protein
MLLLIEYEINNRIIGNIKIYTLPETTKLSPKIRQHIDEETGMLLIPDDYADKNGTRCVIGHINPERYLKYLETYQDDIDIEIKRHIRQHTLESILN